MSQEILNEYNIFISSSQRQTGTPSSFSIILPNAITLNNIVPSELSVFIDKAQIPFSFSQFTTTAGNTQCSFQYTRNTTVYNLSFTIPNGNYNVLTLAQVFIDNVISACLLAAGYVIPLSYSYNGDTNYLTFSLGTGDGITTKLQFNMVANAGKGLMLAMGFVSSWGIALNQSATSTQDVNVSPSRALYITSSTLQQGKSWNAITTPFQSSSILAMVPLEASPLLFITHLPRYITRKSLTNSSVSEIQITLRDEQMNELVDMVLDWSFHLIIYEMRVDYVVQQITRENLNIKASPEMPYITPENKTAIEQYKKEQEEALKKLRDEQLKKLEKLKSKLESKKI